MTPGQWPLLLLLILPILLTGHSVANSETLDNYIFIGTKSGKRESSVEVGVPDAKLQMIADHINSDCERLAGKSACCPGTGPRPPPPAL